MNSDEIEGVVDFSIQLCDERTLRAIIYINVFEEGNDKPKTGYISTSTISKAEGYDNLLDLFKILTYKERKLILNTSPTQKERRIIMKVSDDPDFIGVKLTDHWGEPKYAGKRVLAIRTPDSDKWFDPEKWAPYE